MLSVICLTGVLTEDDMMEVTIASNMLVSEVVLLQNDDIIVESSVRKQGSERTEREKALSRLRSRLGGYGPSAGSANSENFTRK